MTETLASPRPGEVQAPEPVEPETAPPSADELLRADRVLRRRRRRRLMLWGLPVALLMLLLAGKLLSMVAIGGQAVAQYEDGDYEGSLNTAELLKTANIIERWKASYDVGTGYLQLGALDQARAQLEESLTLALPGEACPVRANLAIAIERQGDARAAAGDPDGARALWQEALDVLLAMDPSCPQSTSGPAMSESGERIWQKLNPEQQSSSSQDQQDQQDQQTPPGESPSPSSQGQDDGGASPEEQLQQQMQENEQQRQEQLDEEQQGGAGGPATDRPW